jgi:flavin reductase (DIM6/NTAB) family NADH-FMN oxidoreductase RutF
MSDDAFGRVCESVNFPMAVVTAFDGRERSGCLVGFHTQCSIAPRRWIVCISKANHTFGVARGADRLALHFLHAGQHDLAQIFGGTTGDAIGPAEKFERCGWHPDATGTPILDGCNFVAGRVIARVDAGDHVAHTIDVDDAGCIDSASPPLGFRDVHDIRPGHKP